MKENKDIHITLDLIYLLLSSMTQTSKIHNQILQQVHDELKILKALSVDHEKRVSSIETDGMVMASIKRGKPN